MFFNIFLKFFNDVFLLLLSFYFIKLCIGITTSGSFELSTFKLFISLIQSVNGERFLNIAYSLLLSVAFVASVAPAPTTSL